MTGRQSAAIAVLVATAACGGSGSPPAGQAAGGATASAAAAAAAQTAAAQAPARGADQTTQQLQRLARGLPDGASRPPLVAGDRLQALLPDVSGWQRDDAKFHERTMGVASFSLAEARYSRDDAEVLLSVTDSAMNQLLLAPLAVFTASNFNERHSNGYTRALSISGSPGFEKWNQSARQAEVTAVVGNRFIVAGNGRGVDAADTVRRMVEAVNLMKLAELR
jgi:hypothetical protein